ncbi:ankyrin repeat-containing domain protein [Xylariaceae sp. FL0016]|nr:ankyrin repeat-containing domain protein [Xylariaceae sp. FL0016]
MSLSSAGGPPGQVEHTKWECHKEQIWRWYIGEDLPKKELVRLLRDHGYLDVKLYQLEYRLDVWGMRKNLKDGEGNWMSRIKKSREDILGKATAFILSGKRMSSRKVERAIRRYNDDGLTLSGKFSSALDVVPEPPSSDLALVAYTPVWQSEEQLWQPWPDTPRPLPWISFCEFLSKASVEFRVSERTSIHQDVNLLLTPHTSTYLSSQSIEKVAEELQHYMPETFPGQNVRRAHSLARTWPEIDLDMLQLIVFRLSEGFHKKYDIPSCKEVVRLCEILGVFKPSTLRPMFTLALEQATTAAFLQNLFLSACTAGEAGVVALFIKENNHHTQNASPIIHTGVIDRALKTAVRYDTGTQVLRAILASETYDCSLHRSQRSTISGWVILNTCIRHNRTQHVLDVAVALSKIGVAFELNDEYCDATVLLAISTGETRFIPWLRSRGVHLSSWHIRSDLGGFTEISWVVCRPYYDPNDKAFKMDQLHIVAASCPYVAAVVSCCHDFWGSPKHLDLELHTKMLPDGERSHDLEKHHEQGQQRAIRMYRSVLEERLQLNIHPEYWDLKSIGIHEPAPIDVLVIASARGYNDLVRRLVLGPQDLNRCNGKGMSPLRAAVIGNQLRTCRLLLHMGADPNFNLSYDPRVAKWACPLHIAVFYDSTVLVSVLVSCGADLSHRCAVNISSEYKDRCWKSTPESYLYQEHYYRSDWKRLTALSFAIYRNSWSVAQLLISRQARFSHVEFRLAVCYGIASLVRDMLAASGMNRDMLNHKHKDMTPLDLAMKYREIEMARQLLSYRADADPAPGDLIAAAASGHLSLVRQLTEGVVADKFDHEKCEALSQAILHGHINVVNVLSSISTPQSDKWLPYAFASHNLSFIENLLQGIEDLDVARFQTYEGRSYLEIAILSENDDIYNLAIGLDRFYYDSGSLCASVIRSAKGGPKAPLQELLRRRELAPKGRMDPLLENTAIGLAAYYHLNDVLDSLLERPWSQSPCIIPTTLIWVSDPVKWGNSVYGEARNPEERLVVMSSSAWTLPASSGWVGWHADECCVASALFYALKGGNECAIDALLRDGYLPDGPSLLVATYADTMSGESVRHLISKCQDMKFQESEGGRTALFVAVVKGQIEATHALIQNGANVNAYSKHLIFESTLEYDTWTTSRCVRSPLQHAIAGGDPKSKAAIVDLLIEAGADINAPAQHWFGATALQLAAMTGNITLARKLIGLGADIDAPRALISGRTCLEGASQQGRLSMVQFLLNQGVSTTGIARVQYIRAVSLGEREGHYALSNALREHRQWTDEDKELYEALKPDPMSYSDQVFLHPNEHSREETENLLQWCHQNRKRSWPITGWKTPENSEYENSEDDSDGDSIFSDGDIVPRKQETDKRNYSDTNTNTPTGEQVEVAYTRLSGPELALQDVGNSVSSDSEMLTLEVSNHDDKGAESWFKERMPLHRAFVEEADVDFQEHQDW